MFNYSPHPQPFSQRVRGEQVENLRVISQLWPSPPAPLPKGEGRASRKFAGHFTGFLIITLTPRPLSQRERGE